MMRSESSSKLKRIYRRILREREATEELQSYRKLARKEQLPPERDWFCWLILAGRGFGKTWTGSNWIVEISRRPQYKRILLGGRDRDNILGDMVYGASGIYAMCPPDYKPEHRRGRETEALVFPSGAIAYIRSPRLKHKIRGMNLNAAWIDEAAVLPDADLGLYEESYMSNVLYALRAGQDNKLLVTTTPQPVKLITDLINLPRTVVVRGSTYDNISNLSRAYLENVVQQYERTSLGLQEIYGEIIAVSDTRGWRKEWIRYGDPPTPDRMRIAIGVDPAAGTQSSPRTHTRGTGVTGIVVLGTVEGFPAQYWVLEDLSIKGSPSEWCTRVVEAWHRWQAEVVVLERNMGGDMIATVLQSIHEHLPLQTVWAGRSKIARTEPMRLAYERGHVWHAAQFEELELQMMGFPMHGTDRVDALVWAYMYLSGLHALGAVSSLIPSYIKIVEDVR